MKKKTFALLALLLAAILCLATACREKQPGDASEEPSSESFSDLFPSTWDSNWDISFSGSEFELPQIPL